MVEKDHYSDIDIQICSDLLTKIGIQKEKALIITGSVAAGKSTLAKELGRRLPKQVPGIKTTTVLASDWAGFSRQHRKRNLQSDMKTWFRDFRIYDMLIKYYKAKHISQESVTLRHAYQHNDFPLNHEKNTVVVPISDLVILEGVYSLTPQILHIFSKFGVSPVTLYVDAPVSERIQRDEKRAPFWGKDPSECLMQSQNVHEPAWIRIKDMVELLSQFKADSSQGQFIIQANPKFEDTMILPVS